MVPNDILGTRSITCPCLLSCANTLPVCLLKLWTSGEPGLNPSVDQLCFMPSEVIPCGLNTERKNEKHFF